jgi:hypothetical protein
MHSIAESPQTRQLGLQPGRARRIVAARVPNASGRHGTGASVRRYYASLYAHNSRAAGLWAQRDGA